MMQGTDLAALEGSISLWAEKQIATDRIAHVRGTVATAAQLADCYAPVESARVRLAGWIHDVARDWDDARLLAAAEDYGLEVTPVDRAEPVLLHGAVGYALAAEQFGMNDALLREACALHTTGAPGLSTAAKIVFIADLAEPTRRHKRALRLRAIMFDDLDTALLLGVDSVIRYLVKRHRPIDPRTIALHNSLIAAGVTYAR